MKIIYILLITLFSVSINAQENPFVGTWEYDNGNTIFRVVLNVNDQNRIRGDYELVNKNSGTIIYQSRQDLGHGYFLEHSIYGGNINNKLGAGIDDRTLSHPGYAVLMGQLKMELLNTSPYQTATWKVKRRQGVILSDDYREFNIPTDIILTKIEDNPVIDD